MPVRVVCRRYTRRWAQTVYTYHASDWAEWGRPPCPLEVTLDFPPAASMGEVLRAVWTALQPPYINYEAVEADGFDLFDGADAAEIADSSSDRYIRQVSWGQLTAAQQASERSRFVMLPAHAAAAADGAAAAEFSERAEGGAPLRWPAAWKLGPRQMRARSAQAHKRPPRASTSAPVCAFRHRPLLWLDKEIHTRQLQTGRGCDDFLRRDADDHRPPAARDADEHARAGGRHRHVGRCCTHSRLIQPEPASPQPEPASQPEPCAAAAAHVEAGRECAARLAADVLGARGPCSLGVGFVSTLRVLDPASCASLVRWFEEWLEGVCRDPSARDAQLPLCLRRLQPSVRDVQLPLSRKSLCRLLDPAAVAALERCFAASHGLASDGAPCVRYRLRRSAAAAAAGEGARLIRFHADASARTMQVALNAESEYEGGRVVYATASGLLAAPREPGSATVHGDDVVHGVTALTRGVRYALFLLGRRARANVAGSR